MTLTAFFPGSFDPPTRGHVDLARRVAALVDRLVVGIGVHADKSPWLPAERRVALLQEVLPEGVEVVTFDGLAVDAARAAGAQVLVRGVRDGSDADAELRMARANRHLAPALDTWLLPAAPAVCHVSARLVREVHRSGGDVAPFVPEAVAAALAGLPRGGPGPSPRRPT